MPTAIVNGVGDGSRLKINASNQALVQAETLSTQYFQSRVNEQAYQVLGESNLLNGTAVALHVKNDSATHDMVITYVRHQLVGASGGTAFPNTSNYFRLAFGRVRSSGGTEAVPVNVKEGSTNLSDVTCYTGTVVLTGDAKVIDRWYTKDNGDMNVFNKEGSVIVPPSKTLELSYVGDHTTGIIYSRLSFLMVPTES